MSDLTTGITDRPDLDVMPHPSPRTHDTDASQTDQEILAAFLRGARPVSRFSWLSFDVSAAMPTDWREKIVEVARHNRITKRLVPPHSTSRESSDVMSLQVITSASSTRRRPVGGSTRPVTGATRSS
jgi:hypothetical protein